MIDLHVHSTFSDGTMTPAALAALGRKAGLTAMALTDHDCMGGIPGFLAACAEQGGADGEGPALNGISGVEISAEVGKGTLHMLGYHVDPECANLQAVLEQIRDGRQIRNLKILGRLNELGVKLEWEDVARFAGEDVVGRPHFAQAMEEKGYVRSKTEAFQSYLAKGQSAYMDRFRLSPAESVAAILDAGGVPVLAHPYTLELDETQFRKTLWELKEMGLAGLEVYYTEHSSAQVREYLDLCRELDLVATGGSDFHGSTNPRIRLGVGFGSLRVPDELVPALFARSRPSARSRGEAGVTVKA